MWGIFKKEIGSFWHSLIGYVVVLVFLLGNGLFIWVLPDTNVLDYGYANLDTLFSLGPYLLLFLVPAITMKSFAEETKTGTIELLFTKPLTDTEIILGKYLACVALVIISILPTLVYYFSIVQLGNPVGNIDSAGFVGSFIGLILLGAVFVSAGILASSLTDNQILSFITSLLLCFLLYQGFDLLAGISEQGAITLFVSKLGIQSHYHSFSKGLIDSRDLVYFLAIIAFMLLSTRLKLASRNWE
jgi:ABC-2 type transport system permease protein